MFKTFATLSGVAVMTYALSSVPAYSVPQTSLKADTNVSLVKRDGDGDSKWSGNKNWKGGDKNWKGGDKNWKGGDKNWSGRDHDGKKGWSSQRLGQRREMERQGSRRPKMEQVR